MTIRDFRQLRELELVVTWPESPNNALLLSSITSTELRKITFLVRFMYNSGFAQRMEQWGFIDEQLCGLVDRLHTTGYNRTLEVKLRLAKYRGDPGEYDFTKFLPGFREKGVLTVIDTFHSNQLLHSSAVPTQPNLRMGCL